MRPVSEEERKWFMEAMEAQQEDLVKRMKNIKVALDEKDDADEQVLQVLHGRISDLLNLFRQQFYHLGQSAGEVPRLWSMPDGWAGVLHAGHAGEHIVSQSFVLLSCPGGREAPAAGGPDRDRGEH